MSTGAGASDLLHAEDTGLDQIIRGEQAVAARSPLQLFWRRFRRDRVAMTALAFIVVLIAVAILANPITKLLGAPAPNVQQTAALDDFGLPEGPSGEHLFGVDPIGRDVFARVLYGAQVSLTVAFIGTGMSVIFGVFLGTVAAYYRRWVDTIIARALDVMLAFPVLLLGLGLATACSGENGCVGGLIQPALSFLGVGVQPPRASWGEMLSDAVSIFDVAWWFMFFPGIALLLTVLAFNLVGDGLQDALNPKSTRSN